MKKEKKRNSIQVVVLILLSLWVMGCSGSSGPPAVITVPPDAPQEGLESIDGLTKNEISTLSSIVMVDDFPLYTMQYFGGYEDRFEEAMKDGASKFIGGDAWACSLFVTLDDPENMLFGRNFDWDFSPAILLFTDPPEGYASVSMVDIHYLDFGSAKASTVTDLPLVERISLLDAPLLPFDGMNETGLAVGMAAVPPGGMAFDSGKDTVDSLMVIRKILDHASTIDEAVEIISSYNIDMVGTPLHYLVADASGRSVLVEFYQGEMVVIPNEDPWHLATNFLRSSVEGATDGISRRYDTLLDELADKEGQLALTNAFNLLADVAQPTTQWSIVYGMSTGEVSVVMGREYENIYKFTRNDWLGE